MHPDLVLTLGSGSSLPVIHPPTRAPGSPRSLTLDVNTNEPFGLPQPQAKARGQTADNGIG